MWCRCCGGCDSVQAVGVPTSPILQSVSGRPQLLSTRRGSDQYDCNLFWRWRCLILTQTPGESEGVCTLCVASNLAFIPACEPFTWALAFWSPGLSHAGAGSALKQSSGCFSSRPIMSNAGDTPVVECLDARMVRRVWLSASLKIFPSSRQARIPFLRVLFSLSTPPLLSGWYTAVLMCLMDRTVRTLRTLQMQIAARYPLWRHWGGPSAQTGCPGGRWWSVQRWSSVEKPLATSNGDRAQPAGSEREQVPREVRHRGQPEYVPRVKTAKESGWEGLWQADQFSHSGGSKHNYVPAPQHQDLCGATTLCHGSAASPWPPPGAPHAPFVVLWTWDSPERPHGGHGPGTPPPSRRARCGSGNREAACHPLWQASRPGRRYGELWGPHQQLRPAAAPLEWLLNWGARAGCGPSLRRSCVCCHPALLLRHWHSSRQDVGHCVGPPRHKLQTEVVLV